jgi:hypothetical protein
MKVMGVATGASNGKSGWCRTTAVTAALLIEAARGLDLGHLFARGHRDGERRLDAFLLVLGWDQELDPDHGGSDRHRPFALDEHALRGLVDRNHRRSAAFSSCGIARSPGSVASAQ